MTPILLGVLAVVLAWPAPRLLARVTRLRRTPASAVLLWQSVALAAVLAALGTGVSLVSGGAWQRSPGPVEYAVAAVALLVTGLVALRLLVSGHVVGTELRALRRRHRDQVDLVGRRVADDGVRVLDHPLPVAYCVPRMGGSRIVLSSGALAELGPAGLGAVLAHEQAHLAARHDLVVELFNVLHRAFPRGVSSVVALTEVSLLVEVLADRVAARAAGAQALGRALLVMAQGRVPHGSLGAGDAGLVARIGLLSDTGSHRVQTGCVAGLALAVVALPTLFVVLPWLDSLR